MGKTPPYDNKPEIDPDIQLYGVQYIYGSNSKEEIDTKPVNNY